MKMKRVLALLLAVTIGMTSFMLTGCGDSKKISEDDIKSEVSSYQKDLEELMTKAENETQMADSLVDFCKEKGFKAEKVKGSNVVITSGATKDAGKAQKDAFLVEFRKDTSMSSCSTMAAALAAVKNSARHGEIKLVFSPYSADDSIGVSQLDSDIISGDRVIALERTSNSMLMDGSAGSRNYLMSKHMDKRNPNGTLAYEISINGLTEANSGDRSSDHINPIVFIGDILSDARADAQNIELASFESTGDTFDYPTSAKAVVVIDKSIKNKFESRLEKALSRFDDKKGDNDTEAVFEYKIVDTPSQVYSYDDTANILSLIYTLIDGVFATSEPDYEGDVTGLSSIYKVDADGEVKVSVLGRYTDSSILTQMDTTFDTIAQLSGFTVESEDMTNLWKQEDNKILQDKDFTEAFSSYDPEKGALYSFTSAVCSQLAEDIKGISVISIGVKDGNEDDTAMDIINYLEARCESE